MILHSKSIGEKITEARKKINLSQAELAKQVSISAQAVGKWERGESMPDITTLIRLSEIFEVDLNYFSEKFRSALTTDTSILTPSSGDQGEPQGEKRKSGWNMSNGNWVDGDFSGLKNLSDKFGSSNMKNCKFVDAEMPRLILNSNNVDSCDFSKSNLSLSKFTSSHLINNVFEECSLNGVAFNSSYIRNCNFQRADLTGITFKSSSLICNIIEEVAWVFVTFHSTDIADMIFEGTIQDCAFEYCSFSKVTFSNATLKNSFFKCKTLKHIRFIECKADRLTYEFLKNGKANLDGVTLLA